MEIRAIDEYNDNGHLIYLENFIGAYVRGETREEALQKLKAEVCQYTDWLLIAHEESEAYSVRIVEEKVSKLQICDADSDIIFKSEMQPLTEVEYEKLKAVALKSAKDFLTLYRSIPNKDGTILSPRKTFYGDIPVTASEMYEHTKNVNNYYFNEVKVCGRNEPDILTCREEGFRALESQAGFLNNIVYDGSYGEQWSIRKVCRRFIWHDRIHAKAMYRMAVKLCGQDKIRNPFCFREIGNKFRG